MDDTEKSEAQLLIEARKRLGLTQSQVAFKAQINLQQYQKFEGGQRKLSSSSFWIAYKVITALGLDFSAFARGDYDTLSESN